MIWLYRLFILPFFLLTSPYFLKRMLKRGGYGKDFSHRFGSVPKLPPRKPGVGRIWIQAVSVGETEAVVPLLQELKKRDDVEVILTTTTSTAYKIICEKYADLVAAYAYFPLDFFLFSRRAWSRFSPSLAILMEGELWPEHLHQARVRGIPVLLVNARLSDKSFRRYKAFSFITKRILSHIDFVAAGTANDYNRFELLGVPKEKLGLIGNMKFDAARVSSGGVPLREEEKDALFAELFNEEIPAGACRPKVLLGSSTWPGEEEILIEAANRTAAGECELPSDDRRASKTPQRKPIKLLIVPRHAERRNEIVKLMKKTNLTWYLRSKTKKEDIPPNADVCVADTTGELRRLTSVATVAYVGKSMPPNDGGQTPIECAAFGVPMVYGPAMTNFRDICNLLEDAGAAIKVRTKEEAVSAVCDIISNADKWHEMSLAATRWYAHNLGATKRVCESVARHLAQLREKETPQKN
ncbi:MAG: 3-deoxy-D-manno-octulosonic acid transferase [Opitutae bacterium]|nr:3-deoxy-D-manno-octulosonic acid transferase [Opitutae bacterium]